MCCCNWGHGACCSWPCCPSPEPWPYSVGANWSTSASRRPYSIDWLSVPLAAAGFGALVYGLSGLGAGNAAQAPMPPAATTLVGAVLVGLFAWRQLALQRSSTPLLDLRALTFRHFSVALGLMCLSFMALMGAFILLPIYLQEVCGLTSLQTGLLLIPGGLTMGLLGPQVGKLYDRLGAPRLVVPGAALTALCLALFALMGEQTSPWLVLALYVALSAGMAFVFTPSSPPACPCCRRTSTPTAPPSWARSSR